MTSPPSACVVVLRITPMHPAQHDAQRILSRRKGYQMDMVGHQAPSQQLNAGIAEIFPDQPQIGQTVYVDRKRLMPIHTALRNMAGNPRKYTSVSSRHLGILRSSWKK